MPLEERFIHRDVFHARDALVVHFHDAIHQQEGVAVGEHRCDVVDVHQGLPVGSEVGQILLSANHLGQFFGECHVSGVSRSGCKQVTLNESPSQRQVSNDVQQLVARRLVGKPKVGGVDHAGLLCRSAQGVAAEGLDDVFDFCLAVGTLGEHDGVVNVTTGAAGFLDLGHERQCRSIQNGHLRTVEFEYGVVNA